ncbi:hypothetical protein ABK040_010858 [Willaertia magna]
MKALRKKFIIPSISSHSFPIPSPKILFNKSSNKICNNHHFIQPLFKQQERFFYSSSIGLLNNSVDIDLKSDTELYRLSSVNEVLSFLENYSKKLSSSTRTDVINSIKLFDTTLQKITIFIEKNYKNLQNEDIYKISNYCFHLYSIYGENTKLKGAKINNNLIKLSLLVNSVHSLPKLFEMTIDKIGKDKFYNFFVGFGNIYLIKFFENCSNQRVSLFDLGLNITKIILNENSKKKPEDINIPVELYESIFTFFEKRTNYEQVKPILQHLVRIKYKPSLSIYLSIVRNLYNNRVKLIYPFFNLIKEMKIDNLNLFEENNWKLYGREMYALSFSLDVELIPLHLFKRVKELLNDTKDVEPYFFCNHPLVLSAIVKASRLLNIQKEILPYVFESLLKNKENVNVTTIRLFIEYLDVDLNLFSLKNKLNFPGMNGYYDIFTVTKDLVSLYNINQLLPIQNYLLKYCLKENRYEQAYLIFKNLDDKYTSESLVTLFNIYEKNGNFVEANLLMKKLISEEYDFDIDILSAYFKAMIASKRDCLDEFINFTKKYKFSSMYDNTIKMIYHELNQIKKGLAKESENRIKSVLED